MSSSPSVDGLSVPWNLIYGFAVVCISALIVVVNKQVYTASVHLNYSAEAKDLARRFIGDSARWNTVAQQDTNPAIALMHATFAVAYCNAARALLDDGEIMRSIGVHMPEMSLVTSNTQQKAFQAMSSSCPAVAPADSDGYAIYTGYTS